MTIYMYDAESVEFKFSRLRRHLNLIELKGKLGQSSVNGLLNNPSSVNPLPLPDIMEVDCL